MDRREFRAKRVVQSWRTGQRENDSRQVLWVCTMVLRSYGRAPMRTDPSSNAGYCFVDFGSPAAAAKALSYNGTIIPNSNRPFKLNWASGGGLADRRYTAFYYNRSPKLTMIAVTSVVQSTRSSLATLVPKSMSLFWSLYSKTAFHPANLPRS